MEYRVLKGTDYKISRVGLGCSAFWAHSSFSEDKAYELVETAIELGINFFDTGSSYAKGNAEKRLGSILSSLNKSNIYIATKVGSTFNEKGRQIQDFTPDWIKKSVDESLERLQIDHIHLLQLHGPLDEKNLNDDVAGTLADLKSQGLIGACGLSSFDPKVVTKSLNYPVYDTTMLDYNLIRQGRESLIDDLAKQRSVFAATPLTRGLIGTRLFQLKSKADLWYLARAMFKLRQDFFRSLSFSFLKDYPELSPEQISLAYVLSNQNITSAVFGTTSIKNLKANVEATKHSLSDELIEKIKNTK